MLSNIIILTTRYYPASHEFYHYEILFLNEQMKKNETELLY